MLPIVEPKDSQLSSINKIFFFLQNDLILSNRSENPRTLVIKKHFNTSDCIRFTLIENYANENADINNANKALKNIMFLQQEWYKRKNKNLSKIT